MDLYHSENIGALAKALACAQSQMRGAVKDAMNPFFKTHYSTLASIWDACRSPLGSNGLAVVQAPVWGENGAYLETLLMHESGEWIGSKYALQFGKLEPQMIGSVISYARRYALAAMVGVVAVDEDDDGEKGMGRGRQVADKKEPSSSNDGSHSKPLTVAGLLGMAKHAGIASAKVQAYSKEKYGITLLSKLSAGQLDEVARWISNSATKDHDTAPSGATISPPAIPEAGETESSSPQGNKGLFDPARASDLDWDDLEAEAQAVGMPPSDWERLKAEMTFDAAAELIKGFGATKGAKTARG